MSKTVTCPIGPNFNIADALDRTRAQLQAQGYEVTAMPLGDKGGTLTVSKDNDGIKNLIGLGVECTVTLTVMNGMPTNGMPANGTSMNNGSLLINIEASWTNKIIALCLGWFICLVPFFTGIVGCVNQSDLPKKITTAVQAACANVY